MAYTSGHQTLDSGGQLVEPAGIGVRLQQGAFHILFFVLCAIVVGA